MQHKWAKEIKAWADGAEIEFRFPNSKSQNEWKCLGDDADWSIEGCEFRIKPQPKEPQYLYVYKEYGMPFVRVDKIESPDNGIVFIGKIKLEVKDV
jgi:hypothetical protein